MIATKISIQKSPTTKIDALDFEDIPFGRSFSDHMFIADYSEGEWKNLRIEPFGRFSIHPANIAWHYGQAVFEGMKATKSIDGTPMLFRPEMHAQRINLSAARLCMPSFPEDDFVEAVYELVKLEKDGLLSYKNNKNTNF